jgi:hypothetical protein
MCGKFKRDLGENREVLEQVYVIFMQFHFEDADTASGGAASKITEIKIIEGGLTDFLIRET